MANEVVIHYPIKLEGQEHKFVGGYAQQNKDKRGGQLYTGPDHLVKKMNGIYGIGVRRG
jgi:hypothetical protein